MVRLTLSKALPHSVQPPASMWCDYELFLGSWFQGFRVSGFHDIDMALCGRRVGPTEGVKQVTWSHDHWSQCWVS